jgi:hypothetical protein
MLQLLSGFNIYSISLRLVLAIILGGTGIILLLKLPKCYMHEQIIKLFEHQQYVLFTMNQEYIEFYNN